MEELQLISGQDLNLAGREFTESIDEEKVRGCIMEALHLDLKPLMGDAFYWDLHEALYDDKYQKLMDGDGYEDRDGNPVHFVGLRTCIAYFAAARVASRQNLTYTNTSLVVKRSQYSEQPEPEEKGGEVSALKSGAFAYWNDTKKYLDAKELDFPYWMNTNRRSKPRGNIKITPVG